MSTDPSCPAHWRLLNALDTGGRPVLADLLLTAQQVSQDDLVAVQRLGWTVARWRDQTSRALIDLPAHLAAGGLLTNVVVKLTLTGLRVIRTPHNMVLVTLGANTSKWSLVSEVRKSVRADLAVFAEMFQALMIAAARVDGNGDLRELGPAKPLTDYPPRELKVRTTHTGRSYLPLG